jgi:3-hydroxyacyl-[acyl-carrier-protein] dehydratase
MRPAPFIARWQAGPLVAGAFEARLVLDDEKLFEGHYPGAPIFPGTSLIEALFQAASTALGGGVRLEEIVACRFHAPLLPGDEIAARFALKDAGEGRTLAHARASGREYAAEITMLLAPPDAHSRSADPSPPAPPRPQAVPNARELDASFIRRTLPHRNPALLVDSALVLDLPGASSALLARKAITTSEPCYGGNEKLLDWSYPGSLIIESFCQACGLLRAATATAGEPRKENKENKVPVVAKLSGLRLLGEAKPGDVLEHQVQLVVRTGDGAVFSGHTVVNGRAILHVARVVAAQAPLSSLLATR